MSATDGTAIPERDDEAVIDRLGKMTEALVQSRAALSECRGVLTLFEDLNAWQDDHRPEISVAPTPMEGSTVPCRICGETIEGVPTTYGHSVRVALPHDHFAYIKVEAGTTLPGSGAFCARCVTSAILTIATHGDSWAGQKYLTDKGHAETPPETGDDGRGGA